MTLTNLSLFTGSGIGDLAAKQAGITTVAQCENDPVCCYALRKLWPDCHLFTDVHDVTADALARTGIGRIDIVSGGFPCQDLSTAGKGAGIHGKRSGLWFEMLRVIDEVGPAWVLAENVPALRGRGSDTVLAGLERLGYACWPVVVGAWAIGAPHKRDRVWIVGHTKSDGWRELERMQESWRSELGWASGAGQGLADRPRQQREQRPERNGTGECGELADADCRQKEHGWTTARLHGRFGCEGVLSETRWPSRPGEPQHEWEAPRITQSGVGIATDGLARELLRRVGLGDDRIPSARAMRYVVQKVEGYTRKAALRALGNGWVPQVPYLIYKWIVEESHA